MKLREKLFDAIFDGLYMYKRENALIDSEKIADDYAIEFAQWVQFHSELWIKYKTKELLEIFKKEKGL